MARTTTVDASTDLQRIREEFDVREMELDALRELDTHLLREDVTLDDFSNLLLQFMQRLLRIDRAQVWMRRHNGQLEIIAPAIPGLDPKFLDITDSVTGWCAQHKAPVRIGNVGQDSLFSTLYKRFKNNIFPEMLSELAAPILINGTTVGVLNAESPDSDAFDAHHEAVLQTLAGQASLAFKKVKLFNETDVFTALRPYLLSDSPAAEVSIQQILSSAVDELYTYLGDVAHFQIMFREDDKLVVAYSSSGRDLNVRIDIANSVTGEAVQRRQHVIVGDVRQHPRYVGMFEGPIISEMAVPIVVQNEVAGALNFESGKKDFFDDFSAVIVQHFSAQMGWLLNLLRLRFELSTRMRADRANKILQAMGDQASNLVHRIGNVVGPIKLEAEELLTHHQAEIASHRQVERLIAHIRDQANMALQLPVEMQRIFRSMDYVDVNNVIREIIPQFVSCKRIEIVNALTEDLPTIECQGLGQVIYTLIENAKDAMPLGGKIVIRTAKVGFTNLADEVVEISVEDECNGIPLANLERIFDWNFTTKNKEKKGWGFGLAWVKTFVERSGGRISVESVLGTGTTFIVRFQGQTTDKARRVE